MANEYMHAQKGQKEVTELEVLKNHCLRRVLLAR